MRIEIQEMKSKVSRKILWICAGLGFLASQSHALSTNIAKGKGDVAHTVNYTEVNKAFDGDVSTKAMGAPLLDGAIACDLGSKKNLLKIVLNFPDAQSSWYKVQGSDDGAYWTDILRVFNPIFPQDERALPAVSYRYVRIVCPNHYPYVDGGDPQWTAPNINEIEIYERGAGDPAGDAPIVYPTPLNRTGWVLTNYMGVDLKDIISWTDQGLYDPHGGLSLGPQEHNFYNNDQNSSYTIDMGSKQSFNQLQTFGPIRDYAISVSDDGKAWETIARGGMIVLGDLNYAPINFPMQQKRYVKIASTVGQKGHVELKSISLLNTTGASGIDTGDAVNLALHKPVKNDKGNEAVLVDGDTNTSVGVSLATVDLGQVYPLARLHIKFATLSGGIWIKISASDDGVTWTSRQHISTAHTVDHVLDLRVMANYSCRYLKFEFPIHNVGGPNFAPEIIAELEAYKSSPGSVAIHKRLNLSRVTKKDAGTIEVTGRAISSRNATVNAQSKTILFAK